MLIVYSNVGVYILYSGFNVGEKFKLVFFFIIKYNTTTSLYTKNIQP